MSNWNQMHPAYPTWRNMTRNCGLRKNRGEIEARLYEGITVCEEWRDFYAFERWLLSKEWAPNAGLSVCRVDKTKDFSPENCIVISSAEAQDYRRNVFRVDGRSVRKMLGFGPGRRRRTHNVTQRLRDYGWGLEDALSRDVTPRRLLTKLHLKQKGQEHE